MKYMNELHYAANLAASARELNEPLSKEGTEASDKADKLEAEGQSTSLCQQSSLPAG
jgi:hypothetical protein